jgi:hypothetical protein
MKEELFPEEVDAYRAEYGLPEFPEYYDGPGARDLILFRQHGENVCLTQCTLEDAREYCNREDTHGSGWFTGFDLAGEAEDEEPTVTIEGTAYHVLASGDAICPECGAARSVGRIADHMASEHGDEDDDGDAGYDDNDMENPYPQDREDGEGLGLTRPSYGD